jgi:hypothetical protein
MNKVPFATDRLAGLVFLHLSGFCYFRADCGLTFDFPLDKTRRYAVIDPITDDWISILSPQSCTSYGNGPEMYKVYLLRPMLEEVNSVATVN